MMCSFFPSSSSRALCLSLSLSTRLCVLFLVKFYKIVIFDQNRRKERQASILFFALCIIPFCSVDDLIFLPLPFLLWMLLFYSFHLKPQTLATLERIEFNKSNTSEDKTKHIMNEKKKSACFDWAMNRKNENKRFKSFITNVSHDQNSVWCKNTK